MVNCLHKKSGHIEKCYMKYINIEEVPQNKDNHCFGHVEIIVVNMNYTCTMHSRDMTYIV